MGQKTESREKMKRNESEREKMNGILTVNLIFNNHSNDGSMLTPHINVNFNGKLTNNETETVIKILTAFIFDT